MSLAIQLSARNVAEATGGPFGTAIFERRVCKDSHNRVSYKLVSVGVNRVVPLSNSVLHAETVAIQIAQKLLNRYTLRHEEVSYELYTSCEPCAMCLGAVLWSGVDTVVCAARKEDACSIGFDEGPVFDPQSYEYLEKSGIVVKRNVLRQQAVSVLQEYSKIGLIYNGGSS
mmetsp:Transcript_12290/g.17699  ORF Transcript_12290/g.17699 Transcript_12290/m.17699 type:complete len:171 (-) Transcript_12290:136-648(-)